MTGPILHPTHPDHDGPEWNRLTVLISKPPAEAFRRDRTSGKAISNPVILTQGGECRRFHSQLAAADFVGVDPKRISLAKKRGYLVYGWKVTAA